MQINDIPVLIAKELGVTPKQTSAAIELLDGGNTVPFIARYRKEATGALEDEQLRTLEERLTYLRNLVKRQEEILAKIEEQGKLTDELKAAIEKAQKLQELEDLYPDLPPKERENAFVHEHGTTFLMQIGKKLRSGIPHDGRAPDYDDWDLNGDILFWNSTLNISYELSSMGIRVSPESLDRQLSEAHCDDRRALPFHKALLSGSLPFTIGGGIGQSRLCMLILGSAHIGEVQASVWDAETLNACRRAGIPLL